MIYTACTQNWPPQPVSLEIHFSSKVPEIQLLSMNSKIRYKTSEIIESVLQSTNHAKIKKKATILAPNLNAEDTLSEGSVLAHALLFLNLKFENKIFAWGKMNLNGKILPAPHLISALYSAFLEPDLNYFIAPTESLEEIQSWLSKSKIEIPKNFKFYIANHLNDFATPLHEFLMENYFSLSFQNQTLPHWIRYWQNTGQKIWIESKRFTEMPKNFFHDAQKLFLPSHSQIAKTEIQCEKKFSHLSSFLQVKPGIKPKIWDSKSAKTNPESFLNFEENAWIFLDDFDLYKPQELIELSHFLWEKKNQNLNWFFMASSALCRCIGLKSHQACRCDSLFRRDKILRYFYNIEDFFDVQTLYEQSSTIYNHVLTCDPSR